MWRPCRISGSGSDHCAPCLRVARFVVGHGHSRLLDSLGDHPYPDTGKASTSEVIREGAAEIRDSARKVAESTGQAFQQSQKPAANVVIGIILVGLGIVFLARNLNVSWLRWLNAGTLMPIILIILGGLLLVRGIISIREENEPCLSLTMTDSGRGGQA